MDEIIKEGLLESQKIYNERMSSNSFLWSAFTRCVVCGDRWLWGVKDNLKFVCPKCEALEPEHEKLTREEEMEDGLPSFRNWREEEEMSAKDAELER